MIVVKEFLQKRNICQKQCRNTLQNNLHIMDMDNFTSLTISQQFRSESQTWTIQVTDRNKLL